MNTLRWTLTLCTVCTLTALLGAPARASAQSVTVEGQIYGQPQGYAQPPTGYGVQGQVYIQPAAPVVYRPPYQPTYTQPVYTQPTRQIVYEEQTTNIKALWIPGMLMLGVGYGLTAGLGAPFGSTQTYRDWSLVPIIGPWVNVGNATHDGERIGAIIGGAVQTLGIGMFILGLSLQRTVRVARYALGGGERAPSLAFDVLPAAGGGQLGLTLSHF